MEGSEKGAEGSWRYICPKQHLDLFPPSRAQLWAETETTPQGSYCDVLE